MTNSNDEKMTKTSDLSLSRRHFMGAAAAVAAFTYVPKRVLGQAGGDSANNKLNIAGIGVGGQGGGNRTLTSPFYSEDIALRVVRR